jgi:hypothetical protein
MSLLWCLQMVISYISRPIGLSILFSLLNSH